MYEKVKQHLINSGFKKYNTSTSITVKNDMVFSVSPQGLKNDINVWYAIHPLALPNLNISMGWSPAAGSFPKVNEEYTSIPYEPGNIENAMIDEIDKCVLPFFEKCSSLDDLELLYNKGNFRARYPQSFTLLAMKQYEKGHSMLCDLAGAFKTEAWGILEQENVHRYIKMETPKEIEIALESERTNNIRNYKLVNYMKNANKAIKTDG